MCKKGKKSNVGVNEMKRRDLRKEKRRYEKNIKIIQRSEGEEKEKSR